MDVSLDALIKQNKKEKSKGGKKGDAGKKALVAAVGKRGKAQRANKVAAARGMDVDSVAVPIVKPRNKKGGAAKKGGKVKIAQKKVKVKPGAAGKKGKKQLTPGKKKAAPKVADSLQARISAAIARRNGTPGKKTPQKPSRQVTVTITNPNARGGAAAAAAAAGAAAAAAAAGSSRSSSSAAAGGCRASRSRAAAATSRRRRRRAAAAAARCRLWVAAARRRRAAARRAARATRWRRGSRSERGRRPRRAGVGRERIARESARARNCAVPGRPGTGARAARLSVQDACAWVFVDLEFQLFLRYVAAGAGAAALRLPGVAGGGRGAFASTHLPRQIGQVFLLFSHVSMQWTWK